MAAISLTSHLGLLWWPNFVQLLMCCSQDPIILKNIIKRFLAIFWGWPISHIFWPYYCSWAFSLCLLSVTLLPSTHRVKIFGDIIALPNSLWTWAFCVKYELIKKLKNNNNKGWYFEHIKNINNVMIFSLENMMIVSWYISFIFSCQPCS